MEDADPQAPQSIFSGAAFEPAADRGPPHPQGEVLRGRVWVALHMHAGTATSTNIPVNSDNYAMLQTAHAAVARIMVLGAASTA